MSGSDIVHLSCHGMFDPGEPSRSRVVLAAGTSLTLTDLHADRIFTGVDVVVLSACQTAVVNPLDLPDETLGLFAGFLRSGAATVIGTLWPVSDLSTAVLMVKFYERLSVGDRPATALRHAQLWMRDSTVQELAAHRRQAGIPAPWVAAEPAARRPYAAPSHWAAFVAVGD